jgi:hypothetical protein
VVHSPELVLLFGRVGAGRQGARVVWMDRSRRHVSRVLSGDVLLLMRGCGAS